MIKLNTTQLNQHLLGARGERQPPAGQQVAALRRGQVLDTRCCSTALTDVHKRHLSSGKSKFLLLSGFASKAIAHVKGSFCERFTRMCCKKQLYCKVPICICKAATDISSCCCSRCSYPLFNLEQLSHLGHLVVKVGTPAKLRIFFFK